MTEHGDRLQHLGFADYREYLASEAWERVKQHYRASGRPQSCRGCGCPRAQLHHRHYRRVGGRERPEDLIPLCGGCHNELHRLRRRDPSLTHSGALELLRARMRRERAAGRGPAG